MSVPVRLVAFLVGLGALFALAALAGAEIDPSVDEDAEEHGKETEMKGHATTTTATKPALPGLAVAQDGYRLVPERTAYEAGPRAAYAFRIVDDEGESVRDFDLEHERRMHLIIIRRDFQGFQHLHPQQLEDGTWVAEADLGAGGVYRAFADFSTGGQSLTLATDLFVAGGFEPKALPAPAITADAGDGYEVSIDSAAPASTGATPVSFTVTRDGRALDSVEPYLGADGHLVALREHDQAFLHTHPEGEPGGSGPISFQVEYPTAGSYRLFLQFKHGGEVRTAAFTQEVGDTTGGHVGETANGEESGHGHG
jgi:hypothetical protein